MTTKPKLIFSLDDAASQLTTQLKQFAENPKSLVTNRLIRIQLLIENLDIVEWLRGQDSDVKTYWRDREGRFEMAGLGAADIVSGSLMPDYTALITRLDEYLDPDLDAIRYYGGIRFNHKHFSDFKWQPFSSYRFIVPQIEIFREAQKTFLACNFLVREDEDFAHVIKGLSLQIQSISFNKNYPKSSLDAPTAREDFPNRAGWASNISRALDEFRQNYLQKIVLARKSRFIFNRPIDPIDLLWRLRLNNHRAYYFCFQPKRNVAFIGGTPEQLYSRDGDELSTEAVAGTRRRGKTNAEDLQLEEDLLNSEKDVREHRFVVDSIHNTLDKLCSKVDVQDGLSVLKLSTIQHLRKTFNGKLLDDADDSKILAHLHPTPAVGGVPGARAMEKIDEIEKFDRGWYAGPVGWYAGNKTEFAVAIRSGLVFDNQLTLYSGAGIVEGSDDLKEWEEIENKISGFLSAIQMQTAATATIKHSV